jgi:hypothetical protein
MRGGVLPPALLFAALGLSLAFAPRRAWVPSLLALCATLATLAALAALAALAFLPLPHVWMEGIFLGLWISVIATAASVHFVSGLSARAALALSINAGVWAGAVVSVSGSQLDLLEALPFALIFLPASWFISRYASIPVKVVSSWVIAVAVLAGTLQLLPVTPGYLPDHLE